MAYNLKTKTRVALKFIDRKTLSKSDMQERVEREISYLRLLEHPNIIKLYVYMLIWILQIANKEDLGTKYSSPQRKSSW